MKILAAALGLSAISACATSARAPHEDRARIESVLRAYEAAYNARDAAALARVHAEDGGYYMPSGEPIVGREAVECSWSRSQRRGLVLELERLKAQGAVRGPSDAERPATQLSRAAADASSSRCAAIRQARSRSSST